MFPIDVFLLYTTACLILVVTPGPDNLLAIGRGMSQGKRAATISGVASGSGILFHVLAATFGLSLLIQTSVLAFWIVKLLGAAYLIFLGIKVFKSGGLFNLDAPKPLPMTNIFTTGFLSAALNPKPGMFVLAFIPQFVDPELGSITLQMVVYGTWFAVLTAIGFALMGICSYPLARWLKTNQKAVKALNFSAGSTFVLSGIAIALLKPRA